MQPSQKFLHTSILVRNVHGVYRYIRPADVVQRIHEKRMVCDMGTQLDCYVYHMDVTTWTRAMADAWKVDALEDENTFLYCVDMCGDTGVDNDEC